MISISPIPIPDEVRTVLDTLQSNGCQSYLVGGCVRDSILNKQPKDYDICTRALPEQVKALFPKVVDTGIKYGTVTVLTNGFPVEVTTFRKVVYNPDGARATEIVYGTDASEDVRKRDFTINGLLFDGNQLIDYVGGESDLKNRIIRAIEDPNDRFGEDPLRMMRAIRFRCQLGFEIEPATLEAMDHLAKLAEKLSQERIRDEFNKILLSAYPDEGFRLLHQTGLLKQILPELELCFGFQQQNPYHTQDVFEHILNVVKNSPPELNIRWAALFHDIGKPDTFSLDGNGIGHFYEHHLKSCDLAETILNRLKFDRKSIRQVTILVREHMNLLKAMKRSALKRLINRVGAENCEALLKLQIADVKRSEKTEEIAELLRVKASIRAILQEKEPLDLRELAINGDDLKALGIEPGKMMGRILRDLLEKVIDNPELNTRERLLDMVERNYQRREQSR
jgi:tRNA nucleotidyltransferase (CCA-adding enzyme)